MGTLVAVEGPKKARKMTISKSAGLKIRTGNYETIEVSQSISMDIEFEDMPDLRKKDAALTSVLTGLLKQATEDVMKDTSKHRIIGTQVVKLWGDTEKGAQVKED